MSLLSLSLVLFLIMDPLGNTKAFVSYLEGLGAKRQKFVIIREMLIALALILFFNFLGEYIFTLLQISETTVYLSSGVVLFLTAIKILFPTDEPIKKQTEEPFLVPLAIPMIAGPALLATVMLYARTEPSQWTMLAAIFISWLASIAILLSSRTLLRVLGTSGLTACERLMGMILVLIAVQRFLLGIIHFNTVAS